MQFDRLDSKSGDAPPREDDIVARFAGQAENKMRSEPKTSRPRARYGVDEARVVVSAIEESEGAVVRRLQADFQREPFLFGDFRKQVEDVVSQRVGPRSDRQPDDLGTTQGDSIRFFQSFDGGVGVGRGLKIRDEFRRVESTLQLFDSVVDLGVDILKSKSAAGAETDRVAKDATAAPDRSVDIGTGEMRVDADFANDPAKFPLEIGSERIVTRSVLSPKRKGSVGRIF